MNEFEGVIVENFFIKFKNQNNEEKSLRIPGDIYGLTKGQFVGEKCKITVENGQISKVILLSTGKELPKKQLAEDNRPNKNGEHKHKERHPDNRSEITIPQNNKSDKFYGPIDTNELFKQFAGIENYLLKLQKFATAENPGTNKEKFTFYKKDSKEIKPNYNSSTINSLSIRHISNAKSLLGAKNIKDITLKTDWRMALGLGNESVYETSITLHHIYGIPYIPSSSIKGIVRSWIITNCFSDNGNNMLEAEGRAIENQLFCEIFGCPSELKVEEKDKKKTFKSYYQSNEPKIGGDREGKIIFFDAYPINLINESIKVDIMNPHYSDYYSSEGNNIKPPGDYYNPVPIPFLTVQNTSFQFIIGTKQIPKKIIEYKEYEKLKPFDESSLKSEERFKDSFTLIDLAYLWLKLALAEHGIGAKTAVGYGYMK